ncbi:hypothetical protein X797_001234 [Metarhizium robertsii]|uniref:Esterase-like protein n=2 Tax=Metarhizium robertsii TaxID=568076 RepID=E9EXK3_METRA|nr:Esterase-like protein [Metarhizium robertsii ARSEF 23]EFY99823.2 Esterase-like protein [Metarhizium robertsii ARSEF 23]EXV06514.1 hypothetical protein X797_001234 [Metarhizium robertsii]
MASIPFRARPLRAVSRSVQAQRWASYDKSALTKDALNHKVESGLGAGNGDANLLLNTEEKTISTATGDLPLSPLFDSDWIKARRRSRKHSPSKATGRFRKKLANNPYAQALATPIRRCPNTAISLPRYFFQDFELVKHPQDDSPWWAPGPLAFEGLIYEKIPSKDKIQGAYSETAAPQAQELGADTHASTAASSTRPRKSPVTSYALSRKSVIDRIGGPNRKHAALLLATRTGMAAGPNTKNPVWRQDMGDVLLRMMRRQAVDALVCQSGMKGDGQEKLIQPCTKWDAIKEVQPRGCVLWLPSEENSSTQYATLDLDGAKYGGKLTVHNLHWLLGEDELARLIGASELFHDNEILVLKQWKRKSVMKLHLLLWRLQGYLAQPPCL